MKIDVTRPWSFENVVEDRMYAGAVVRDPDRRLIDEALNLYEALETLVHLCAGLTLMGAEVKAWQNAVDVLSRIRGKEAQS